MNLTLHTETFIDSAHYLTGYDGPCCRLHGHTWRVRVWISGDSDRRDHVGIMFDFGKVKQIKDLLDHQIINIVMDFDESLPDNTRDRNPTAENLTMWIYDQLKRNDPDLCFKVRVYETSIGKETYCEGGDF